MHHLIHTTLPLPDITIDAQGVVRSAQFDDIYFSAHGGMAETEHVFLHHNNLPQRWQNQPHFTIAETGFGTGLNFLTAWHHFENSTPEYHTLYYISAERYPLTKSQIIACHTHNTLLQDKAAQLTSMLPLRTAGFHLRHITPRITLLLLYGDAAEQFAQCDAAVDAWFLDGFSPAKNQDLWSDALFTEIERLTAPHGTFSTFTSAARVRDGLGNVGFSVTKEKGFGHKRDMLRGYKSSDSPIIQSQKNKHYAVIGAGLAGAAMASTLARCGHKVSVYEQAATCAAGASGNPVAILYPQFSKQWSASMQLYWSGLAYTWHVVERLIAEGHSIRHEKCGMLQLPRNTEDEARFATFPEYNTESDVPIQRLSADQASALAGVTVTTQALYIKESGWLSIPDLCAALLKHPNISCHYNSGIYTLDDPRLTSADATFITTGYQHSLIENTTPLPLARNRGQITLIPQTAASNSPSIIMCQYGYLTPAIEGNHTLGATYSKTNLSLDLTAEDQQDNVSRISKLSPQITLPMDAQLAGRASFRGTTPDHLPIVGKISPTTYISLGHGSRGAITALLCSEHLLSIMDRPPSPLPNTIIHAIRPQRFDV